MVVEERTGSVRHAELVRVPLFLHDGECEDPKSLEVCEVTAAGEEKPIPYQADDIRHDAEGHISRMHLYFETSLNPWERKRFVLRKGANPRLQPMKTLVSNGTVTFEGRDLQIAFAVSGLKAGAITAIRTGLGRACSSSHLDKAESRYAFRAFRGNWLRQARFLRDTRFAVGRRAFVL
jgi:hypothetical protein